MSRQFIQYKRESDGEKRWAVWSTVVEGIIIDDMTEQQLIEWYAKEEHQKARIHAIKRIKNVKEDCPTKTEEELRKNL